MPQKCDFMKLFEFGAAVTEANYWNLQWKSFLPRILGNLGEDGEFWFQQDEAHFYCN